MGNPIKKLLQQTAIYGLSNIVARLINYLLVPLHTYLMVTADYGSVGELYAYITFINVLLTYGMETTFFRYYKSDDVNKNEVYTTILISLVVSSSIFLVVSFLAMYSIAGWIGYATAPEYIFCLLLIAAIDAITAIPFGRLRAENKPLKYVSIKIATIVLNVFFNIFFLWLCPYILKHYPDSYITSCVSSIYNPHKMPGYILYANLIASVSTFIFLGKDLLDVRSSFNTILWKKLLHYGSPLIIGGLAGMTNEVIDRILLKYLLPTAIAKSELGIYNACYKLSILMTLFVQAFRMAGEPFFLSHAKDKNSPQLYATISQYFLIAGCIVFLGVMANIEWIKFFIAPAYHDGLVIVPLLLLANLLLGMFYNFSVAFKIGNATSTLATISIIGAIITIVLNVLLIPLYGYVGSAIATLVCYASIAVMGYLLAQKYFKIPYPIFLFGMYLLNTVLVYAVFTVLPIQHWLLKTIAMNAILIFYIGYFAYLEKEVVAKIYQSFKKKLA